MNRLIAPLLMLCVVACDCGDGTLGGVDVGFRVSGQPIDFGIVLETTRVTREVELVSESRADVQVEVSVEGPFLAPALITVPAGSVAKVPVTFVAGSSREEGRLLLGPADKKVVVPLVGEGVRPLVCVPSAVCRKSVFELTANACVESPADEGAPCRATNVCLENGSCRTGACVGTARTCDDQNLCTVDGCSATTGCVNAQRTCPPPSKACRVPTCDPQTGCGEAFAQDGTLCGGVDCVNVNMCISGECTRVDTPEGFICLPPTPCQGEGRCTQKQCVRPDGGEMVPEFSAIVSGDVVREANAPTLLAHNGNLYFDVCGLSDGGCELLSYTPTGFLRFNRGHGDSTPRWIQFASDAGVVVNDGESLEAFAISNGSPLWRWDASVQSDSVVVLRDGGIVALVKDSLMHFDPRPDAGVLSFAPFAGGTLAASSSEVLVSWSSGDGGVHLLGANSFSVDAGLDVMVINEGAVLAGGASIVFADGGTSTIAWDSLFPPRAPLSRNVLASGGIGYVFATSCEAPAVPACLPEELQTDVRAVSLLDGTTRWQTKLLPAQVNARLEEAAVVNFVGGALITVADISGDAGMKTFLQLVVDGSRIYSCPLPSGGQMQGAVFDRGRLFVVMDRAGSSRLESYDLKGLPLSTTGWPQRNGVSGTRRER